MTDLAQLVATVQGATQAVNGLNQTLKTVFPQQGASASSANSGTASSLPATPAGYLSVNLNGTTVLFPYYNP